MSGANGHAGHVYIIGFSNGVVKVGRTKHPAKRIQEHERPALGLGISVTKTWTSGHMNRSELLEAHLITKGRSLWQNTLGREWFRDADFDRMRDFAESVDTDRLEREHEIHMRRRAHVRTFTLSQGQNGNGGPSVHRAIREAGYSQNEILSIQGSGAFPIPDDALISIATMFGHPADYFFTGEFALENAS